MSVLVFSELFYPHGSGAELATKLYVDLLAKEGFKVTVVTKRFPAEASAEFTENGVVIYRLSMKLMVGTRYETLVNVGKLVSSFIQRLIKQNDVVYIPCGWYSVIPIAKAYKKPVIVHLHNYSIACSTSLMYDFSKQTVASSSLRSYVSHERLERNRGSLQVAISSFMNETLGKPYSQLGRLADALVFVSKTQMNLTLSELPHLKKRSHCIYNPVPEVPFIETEENAVGYFGGKRFVKGFPVLMSSIGLLKGKPAKVYMTMTSNNPQTIKTHNGVTLNFLPKLSEAELSLLLKKISIVVIPSKWPEPLPYTLLESMMHGKLIIASNIGAIPEMVTDLTSGVKLTPVGDYEQIADAMDSFLALDLAEVNEIGYKLRKYVLDRFDNEVALKYFTDLLYSVQNCN